MNAKDVAGCLTLGTGSQYMKVCGMGLCTRHVNISGVVLWYTNAGTLLAGGHLNPFLNCSYTIQVYIMIAWMNQPNLPRKDGKLVMGNEILKKKPVVKVDISVRTNFVK